MSRTDIEELKSLLRELWRSGFAHEDLEERDAIIAEIVAKLRKAEVGEPA